MNKKCLTTEHNVLTHVTMYTFTAIEKFGGIEAISSSLSTKTKVVSKDAVRMWCQRGRIPGYATRDILRLAEENKLKFSSGDFVARPKKARSNHD